MVKVVSTNVRIGVLKWNCCLQKEKEIYQSVYKQKVFAGSVLWDIDDVALRSVRESIRATYSLVNI